MELVWPFENAAELHAYVPLWPLVLVLSVEMRAKNDVAIHSKPSISGATLSRPEQAQILLQKKKMKKETINTFKYN